MREYAKIFPQIWIGQTAKKIKKFGIESQLLSHYLISCPQSNMIGIYYLPIALISHETGISQENILKGFGNLFSVDFCTYQEDMEYVWVHNMALYQIGHQLKINDNRVKSVNKQYRLLPNLSFLQRFYEKYKNIFWLENFQEYSTQAPSKILLSQEQEQDQDHKQDDILISNQSQKIINNIFDVNDTNVKSQAIQILNFLNQKTGRAYRAVDENLKLIIARLKSGASVIDCQQVIAKKTREWNKDQKMSEFLRPATLFHSTKFEQYIGELVLPKQKGIIDESK